MKTSMRAWVAKSFVSLDKTVSQFKTLTAAAPSATASVSQINIISNSQVPSISNTTTVALYGLLFWECSIEYFLIHIVILTSVETWWFQSRWTFSMSYVFKSQGFLFLLIKFHEWSNHWRSCPTVFSSYIHTHIILSCTCQQYVSCLLYVSRQSSERHINRANIAVRKNGLMF